MDQTQPVLMTVREVVTVTRLSKPTIYKLVRVGDFPTQLRLGENRVAWLQSEVMDWIDQRATARRAS